MAGVQEQYEAYPYPERDPEDEKKRLIQGSPSHPLEMDHYLWGGARDWSVPLRVLVAGGGTGDGLIQLAAVLAAAGRAAEITYIDLSKASRRVAEARARVRGFSNIAFRTGDLTEAPGLGKFDYIDCCGVLHHLPDPAAGFRALAAALAPGGGLGFMVYAPYGRSGVYPLQEAFGALFEGLGPQARLKAARKVFERVPEGHPFKRNLGLVDHRASDAGFYDLLLHSQDQAMGVGRLCGTLAAAGLELVSFVEPARYDLGRFAQMPEGMDRVAAMAAAEKLDGTFKTHIGYAVRAGAGVTPAAGGAKAVPHLKGVAARDLARAVAAEGAVEVTSGVRKVRIEVPRGAAPLIAGIDGRRSLGEIAKGAGVDPIAFGAVWGPAGRALSGWGLLWYSGLLQGGRDRGRRRVTKTRPGLDPGPRPSGRGA